MGCEHTGLRSIRALQQPDRTFTLSNGATAVFARAPDPPSVNSWTEKSLAESKTRVVQCGM